MKHLLGCIIFTKVFFFHIIINGGKLRENIVQDGQSAFLHPFCVKVLAHEYHTFDHLPPVMRGTIVDLEEVVQTEKTRKQFRHLAHLPLTCKFQLVYIGKISLDLYYYFYFHQKF